MTKFRPCIDLHDGQVKQIVGGTLRDQDSTSSGPKENFVATQDAAYFAALYQKDELTGGHIIKLGPGNEDAARLALATYPSGLQIGGGITLDNAQSWLDAGASHIIVTSWLFDSEGLFQEDRMQALATAIGKEKIVIDLSCRKTTAGWTVAMNRWQTLTDLNITFETLDRLAGYCDEFLIHAADVEGLCGGVDVDLVKVMGEWGKTSMTYAGGVGTLADVDLVQEASGGKVDVTVGSALDLFGGNGVKYSDLLMRR